MLLDMSGCRTMPRIPYSTSARKRFREMGRFRARNLAICLVSATSDRLNATRPQNTSPGIGQGSDPLGAPPGIDENVAREGDILFETGVHGQRCQPHQDHQPQGECGEVADIVPKDVSLACAATFGTAHTDVGCAAISCPPPVHFGARFRNTAMLNFPMRTGFMAFGPQSFSFAPDILGRGRHSDQLARPPRCPAGTLSGNPVRTVPETVSSPPPPHDLSAPNQRVARSRADQANCG